MALTRERLMDFLSGTVGIDPVDIDEDTPLYSSGLADSFDMVDMIAFIESETQLRLSPEDISLDNFDSVNRILRFVSCRNGRE